MYPDPFINDSPLWQPYSGPLDADLAQPDRGASDFFDFLRQQKPVQRPASQLPRGMTLNQRSSGKWCLVFPDGASGYRCIEGTREELMAFAAKWTTE